MVLGPMAIHRALRLALLLLATSLACATVADDEPGRLRDEAQALLDAQDEEGAYRKLARIRLEHPGSPEAREVFPAAARLLKRAWWRHRHREPESPWLTTEPGFLFEWLASFYGDGFPQREAEFLLLGMPQGFLRDYEAFAATRPELAAWAITAREDNGILQGLDAVRVDQDG